MIAIKYKHALFVITRRGFIPQKLLNTQEKLELREIEYIE